MPRKPTATRFYVRGRSGFVYFGPATLREVQAWSRDPVNAKLLLAGLRSGRVGLHFGSHSFSLEGCVMLGISFQGA